MARPDRRNSSLQFGDMPVQSPDNEFLRPNKFNWADEVGEEENVENELGQSADGVADVDGTLEDTPVNQEQAGDAIVQDDLATLEDEVKVPNQDTLEVSEQAEDSNLQDNPATFEAETVRPMEEDTVGLEQVGAPNVRDGIATFETEIATPGKITVADPEYTEDPIVQDALKTPILEVAIQEDLMEGVEDKLVTPEIQSVDGMEIEEDPELPENVQDHLGHSEEDQDDGTVVEDPTLVPASDSIVSEHSDTLDSTAKGCPSVEADMDNKDTDAVESPARPQKCLSSSPQQSTEKVLGNKPAVPVMTYAKIAAAGAAAMSPEPVPMSSAVRKDIEKTPIKTPSKTPANVRSTPVRHVYTSTRITPDVPKSFEKDISTRASPFAAPDAAAPVDLGWESIPTEAREKPKQWTTVSTPRKTRKTPLTTPIQSAQQPSIIGDKDDDNEEDSNTLASPSSAVPNTPTKSKSKSQRRRAKIKAAKAAQALASATASVPVVEMEAEATGLERKVEKEEVSRDQQFTDNADAGSIEAPEVETGKRVIKAIIDTAGVEVAESSAVDMEIEVEEEIEVIALARDEIVEPATGRSSIALFIAMLLMAWVVYSFVYYMPDILEYLKESLRSDVPDL
ncbi:hypothetical protein IFR04_003802 [Cadophora malorum]|uniref:Uncharacterized protein n=1 Tax=Cadophora malorum TaxID=108018 RepID=A0A8H7WDS8_9HELO|nr:hypothetical protein IFR04_003802 [Cadophora malorum]